MPTAYCRKCWKREESKNAYGLAICKGCLYELNVWANFLEAQAWGIVALGSGTMLGATNHTETVIPAL